MSTAPPSPIPLLTNLSALLTLLSTLLHFQTSRTYRGHRRGQALSLLHSIFPYYFSASLLLISTISLLSLYFHTLLSYPLHAGTKSELLILSLAVFAFSYGGLLFSPKRRRNVAVRLTSIPCFGNGQHSPNHQLLHPKNPVLAYDSLYLAPSPSQVRSTSSGTSTSATMTECSSPITTPERATSDRPCERIGSPNRSMSDRTAAGSGSPERRMSDRPVGGFGSPERKIDRKRSSTLGITKRKVWEFSCRTASTWVYGRAKRQAWPTNVVRTFRTKGKRFVLIKDEAIQDGAGAVLLEPAFTQSRVLDKSLIARVIFEAVNRATPCVLNSWSKRFDGAIFHRFARLPAIVAMLTGDLRKELERKKSGKGDDKGEVERCYVTEVVWAVITVEVLDYLQYKRKDVPLLTWLNELPTWLCEHDGSKIEAELDKVFEVWKTGRLCGSNSGRPCDSECCCHGAVLRARCGCQCPCVCNCA